MFVESHLQVSTKRRSRVVQRRVFHGLLSQRDRHRRIEPVDALNPTRRDQHLVTEPPIVGVHDEISNGPGIIIEQQPLYVTHATIARLDVMPPSQRPANQDRDSLPRGLAPTILAAFFAAGLRTITLPTALRNAEPVVAGASQPAGVQSS